MSEGKIEDGLLLLIHEAIEKRDEAKIDAAIKLYGNFVRARQGDPLTEPPVTTVKLTL